MHLVHTIKNYLSCEKSRYVCIYLLFGLWPLLELLQNELEFFALLLSNLVRFVVEIAVDFERLPISVIATRGTQCGNLAIFLPL